VCCRWVDVEPQGAPSPLDTRPGVMVAVYDEIYVLFG